MKFPYKKFLVQPVPDRREYCSVLRPVIPIDIIYHHNRISYEALIDSGADYSIFHASIGEAIALKIRDGKQVIFSGVAGVRQEGFRHSVPLQVSGVIILCYIVFSYELKTPYGILGQESFFNQFKVTFDLKAKEINLTVRRSQV